MKTKIISLKLKITNSYMIHQDCYNKYYTINYLNDHIKLK